LEPLLGDPHSGGREEAVVGPVGVSDKGFEHEIFAACVAEMPFPLPLTRPIHLSSTD
jgi:hypothetical protein